MKNTIKKLLRISKKADKNDDIIRQIDDKTKQLLRENQRLIEEYYNVK